MKRFIQRKSLAAIDSRGSRRLENAQLSTPWHLAQRCEDECAREDESSFALLIIELAPDDTDDERILDQLSTGLRRADIVAQLGTNRYAVLLTGAGGYDAGRVASRIRQSTSAQVGVAVFPQDGDNLAELVMAALATIRAASDLAS